MQIVENWAILGGTIESLGAHPTLPDTIELVVHVTDVASVSNLPNFFADELGKSIRLSMPQESVDRLGIAPGDTFFGHVRRGGIDRNFAHPTIVSIS